MDYLILILATWRTSSLLVYEDGPFAIFESLRIWSGVRYDSAGARIATNELSRALLCLWCVSVWVGAAWTILYALDARGVYLALPVALSAGSIIVDEIVNRIKLNG